MNCNATRIIGEVVSYPSGPYYKCPIASRSCARIIDFPVRFDDAGIAGELADVEFIGTYNRKSITTVFDYPCPKGLSPVFLPPPSLIANRIERE